MHAWKYQIGGMRAAHAYGDIEVTRLIASNAFGIFIMFNATQKSIFASSETWINRISHQAGSSELHVKAIEH